MSLTLTSRKCSPPARSRTWGFKVRPTGPQLARIDDENGRAMSDLEDYRKFLMLNLVETFTPIMTPEEERQFKEAMLKPEYRDKGVFRDTWAEELMINGLLEGKRSTLLHQISAKFGPPPEEIVWRIRRLDSLEELDAQLQKVLTAPPL